MTATVPAHPSLEELRSGGKRALARALAFVEERADSDEAAALLDAAADAARAHVIGLTGPPGVGKSTLTGALVKAARSRGETVGVVAVDPSSRRTGGALLGDRIRIATDPEDAGVFVRSFAARERLGGLSETAVAATVLMRAVFDRVLVETVGVGQSEADVALVADTVLLAVQPGSGDGLQFMKAGIMELPDILVVTKADLGAAAMRAKTELAAALGLLPSESRAPVLLVSANTGQDLDVLEAMILAHRASLDSEKKIVDKRARQAEAWLVEAIKERFGRHGLAASRPILALTSCGSFLRLNVASRELFARLENNALASEARLGHGAPAAGASDTGSGELTGPQR